MAAVAMLDENRADLLLEELDAVFVRGIGERRQNHRRKSDGEKAHLHGRARGAEKRGGNRAGSRPFILTATRPTRQIRCTQAGFSDPTAQRSTRDGSAI